MRQKRDDVSLRLQKACVSTAAPPARCTAIVLSSSLHMKLVCITEINEAYRRLIPTL